MALLNTVLPLPDVWISGRALLWTKCMACRHEQIKLDIFLRVMISSTFLFQVRALNGMVFPTSSSMVVSSDLPHFVEILYFSPRLLPPRRMLSGRPNLLDLTRPTGQTERLGIIVLGCLSVCVHADVHTCMHS